MRDESGVIGGMKERGVRGEMREWGDRRGDDRREGTVYKEVSEE